MQVLEVKRLSELIPKGGMSLERIFEIAVPLSDALAADHEKGVIHWDLKSANVMVTGERPFKGDSSAGGADSKELVWWSPSFSEKGGAMFTGPRQKSWVDVLVLFLAMASTLPPIAEAQDPEGEGSRFRFERIFLYDLGVLEEKLIGLAEAIPAESYDWRPADGVRSIREVFMHVYASNQAGLRDLGADVTALPNVTEKTPEKTAVVEALAKSVSTLRTFTEELPDEAIHSRVDFDGALVPKGVVLYILQGHMHEHLGQVIAYARVRGITPPWTLSQPKPGG